MGKLFKSGRGTLTVLFVFSLFAMSQATKGSGSLRQELGRYGIKPSRYTAAVEQLNGSTRHRPGVSKRMYNSNKVKPASKAAEPDYELQALMMGIRPNKPTRVIKRQGPRAKTRRRMSETYGTGLQHALDA